MALPSVAPQVQLEFEQMDQIHFLLILWLASLREFDAEMMTKNKSISILNLFIAIYFEFSS